jgi:hypothetical protein
MRTQNKTSNEWVTIETDDKFKSKAFLDTYGISSSITTTMHNDLDWNWNRVEILFDGKYKLIEIFKEGKDNSTDHVIVATNYGEELCIFKSFIEAEKYLVDLLRRDKDGTN